MKHACEKKFFKQNFFSDLLNPNSRNIFLDLLLRDLSHKKEKEYIQFLLQNYSKFVKKIRPDTIDNVFFFLINEPQIFNILVNALDTKELEIIKLKYSDKNNAITMYAKSHPTYSVINNLFLNKQNAEIFNPSFLQEPIFSDERISFITEFIGNSTMDNFDELYDKIDLFENLSQKQIDKIFYTLITQYGISHEKIEKIVIDFEIKECENFNGLIDYIEDIYEDNGQTVKFIKNLFDKIKLRNKLESDLPIANIEHKQKSNKI